MTKLLWFAVAAAAGVLLSVALARPDQTAENEQPAVAVGPSSPYPDESDWNTIRHWLDHPSEGGNPPIRLRIVQPGVILPPEAVTRPHVPPDMTISITRHGDDPARISVRQGARRWEVSEGEIDKLPADVRPYVDRLLGPRWRAPVEGQKVIDLVPRWPTAAGRGRACVPPENHLRQRLEEMNRQMEQLRQRLEELQADGP